VGWGGVSGLRFGGKERERERSKDSIPSLARSRSVEQRSLSTVVSSVRDPPLLSPSSIRPTPLQPGISSREVVSSQGQASTEKDGRREERCRSSSDSVGSVTRTIPDLSWTLSA
jgi:hypothetical protein